VRPGFQVGAVVSLLVGPVFSQLSELLCVLEFCSMGFQGASDYRIVGLHLVFRIDALLQQRRKSNPLPRMNS
jgi:hypothetical protein